MPGEASWRRRELRTAKPCGPGTRCWCQAGGGASTQPGFRQSFNPSATEARRIRLRGELGISRKAIAQGMSDALRCPVCSCAPHYSFARETSGAARTRHSLRPLKFERCGNYCQTSGASRRENAESYSGGNYVTASAAKQSTVTSYWEGWIASAFARRATADKSRSLSSGAHSRDPWLAMTNA
jgi:hypothetical protein